MPYRTKNSEFDLAVLEFKKKFLLKLLKKNGNNILEVSRQTELSRNTIYKIIGLTKKQLRTLTKEGGELLVRHKSLKAGV